MIPALRHSHKQTLKEYHVFTSPYGFVWNMAGSWLGHNHPPCANKPEGSKPMGALGVGREKGFRVVAQSSGRFLDLE